MSSHFKRILLMQKQSAVKPCLPLVWPVLTCSFHVSNANFPNLCWGKQNVWLKLWLAPKTEPRHFSMDISLLYCGCFVNRQGFNRIMITVHAACTGAKTVCSIFCGKMVVWAGERTRDVCIWDLGKTILSNLATKPSHIPTPILGDQTQATPVESQCLKCQEL